MGLPSERECDRVLRVKYGVAAWPSEGSDACASILTCVVRARRAAPGRQVTEMDNVDCAFFSPPMLMVLAPQTEAL